jgi:hypothetical protein
VSSVESLTAPVVVSYYSVVLRWGVIQAVMANIEATVWYRAVRLKNEGNDVWHGVKERNKNVTTRYG